MLAKLALHDRGALAAWDGEPLEASRAAMRRWRLGAPLTGGWGLKGATVAAVAIAALGATMLYVGLQNATNPAPTAPAAKATATPPIAEPTRTPTAAVAPLSAGQAGGAPELFIDQVGGMRGCGQPVYVRAGGLPALTRVRVERINDPAVQFAASTSATGFLNVHSGSTLTEGCTPGTRYEFRIVDETTGTELSTTTLEIPAPATAEIAIEPPAGGCDEIVVTFRGFPPDAPISLVAWGAEPFAHNGFQVIWPPPITDAGGLAQTAPFAPPWDCDTPALSLTATAGEDAQVARAEVLYRIALGADEPIPALECLPAQACILVP